MKCQYCGNNLGLEDVICPHCGRENSQAAGHVADMAHYKADYEETKSDVITKSSKLNNRTARILVIAVMVVAIAVMLILTGYYQDVDKRYERKNAKKLQEIEKNKDEIFSTLDEMESHRDYLAMEYYVLEHGLRGSDLYKDYTRVFSAALSYEVVYTDIINIVDGYDYYGEKTAQDWCYDIAIYIADWKQYVDGAFWGDTPDSPMHADKHEAFITDAKHDVQDMVQVYFELTDEQAMSMWNMEEEAIGEMLYDKCKALYLKEGADE